MVSDLMAISTVSALKSTKELSRVLFINCYFIFQAMIVKIVPVAVMMMMMMMMMIRRKGMSHTLL